MTDRLARMDAARRAAEILVAVDAQLQEELPGESLYLLNTKLRLAEAYVAYADRRLG